MNILGVRVDNFSKLEILKKIESFLDYERFHQICTINPEFILEAQKNPRFKHVLNGSNLCVADGFGLNLAFCRKGKLLKSRFAGADLVPEILKMAEERNMNVFLAINKGGLSNFEEIKTAILKIYPKLNIEGVELDSKSSSQLPGVSDNCIVFCNFGAPNQGIFLNSQKNATIRLVMGVGGTFDFMTGKAKRAPVLIRKIGLEWLWRLIQNPRRWKRIIKAVFMFPVLILRK